MGTAGFTLSSWSSICSGPSKSLYGSRVSPVHRDGSRRTTWTVSRGPGPRVSLLRMDEFDGSPVGSWERWVRVIVSRFIVFHGYLIPRQEFYPVGFSDYIRLKWSVVFWRNPFFRFSPVL